MNKCRIVQDLLPLYGDGLVSEETGNFIRAHTDRCEECRKKLARQQQPLDEELKIEASTFRSALRRNRNVILVVSLALVLCVVLFSIALHLSKSVEICEIVSPNGEIPVSVIRKPTGDYWVYYVNGSSGGGYLLRGAEEFAGVWFAPSSRYYVVVTTDETGMERYTLSDLEKGLLGGLDPEPACKLNENFAREVREKYGIWREIRFRYLGWDSTKDSILFAYTCTGLEGEEYTGYFWYDVAALADEGESSVTEIFP